MLHIPAFKQPFLKKEAQAAGKVIFLGKPSQDYLFNFLCGVSAVNNGVVTMAFQTIATHMSAKFQKTMTVQAVSQLVKKLVKRGVLRYFSPKLTGNYNGIGTFRIAPVHTLVTMANDITEAIEAQYNALFEEDCEFEQPQPTKEVKGTKNTYVKPTPKPHFAKKIVKSDSSHLPVWAHDDYARPTKKMSDSQKRELQALIGTLSCSA